MFIKKIKKKFNTNEPIFTNEILELFKNYSRAYVFKLIDQAKKKGELLYFDKGIYYIKEESFFGTSTITVDDIVNKKYICNGNSTYGIYGGLTLKNIFSITTQMPNTIEVITNNETMRCRKIEIDGRKIILHKSRCKIDNSNVCAYTILQLLSDFKNDEDINNQTKKTIIQYIKENKVTVQQLFTLAKVFPAQTTKNLIYSGVLNEFTQGQGKL